MSINAKEFYIACKNGVGTFDFMQQQNISSIEILKDLANKFFGAKEAKRIVSSLQKNEKNKLKVEAKKAQDENKNSTIEVSCDVKNSELVEIEEKIEEQNVTNSNLNNLSELKDNINSLTTSLIILELEHKKLYQSNLEQKEKLKSSQEALERLLNMVDRQRNQLSDIITIVDNNFAEMAKLNVKMQQLREEKLLLEKEYEKNRKITIFVFSSDLACDGIEFPVFPKEKIQEMLPRFFSIPNITEYSVALNELTTLCKLMLVVEELQSKDLQTELIFDKQEMQRLFEAL